MEDAQFQSLVIELFRELKEDVRDIKGELREHKRILNNHEQIFKNHEQIFKEQDKKLDVLLASRNSVKVIFGWQWGLASLVIAVCAASMARFVL